MPLLLVALLALYFVHDRETATDQNLEFGFSKKGGDLFMPGLQYSKKGRRRGWVNCRNERNAAPFSIPCQFPRGCHTWMKTEIQKFTKNARS